MITHICTNPRNYFDIMLELGTHGFSIAESVPMAEAREKVGGRIALVGNVNQLFTLIKKGTKEVMEESRKCIEGGTDVLNPGCGFAPKTPLTNIKAMIEATKKYGSRGRLAKK